MTGIEEGALLAYLSANAGTIAAAAAAVSAVGTVYSASKQADAQDYNAKVRDQNAEVARNQAVVREEDQRQRGRAMIGRQLAASSESGAELSGSNLDLLSSSLYGMAMDTANIRYEGALKSSGLEGQAELNRQQADATRTGGYLSAAGQLTGATSSYIRTGSKVPSSGLNGT